MGLVAAKANGLYYPPIPFIAKSPSFTSCLLDQAADQWVYTGQFWTPSRANKNISTVGFLSGAVTVNAGSVLTVSLQNRSATGAPTRPDGSVDQSYTLTGAAIAANTWLSGTLDTVRAVTPGEVLCVVFQITTFNASDQVNLRNFAHADGNRWNLLQTLFSNNGAAFAGQNVFPNVIFGCDDGSFATLKNTYTASAVGAVSAYSSASTPDEQALRWVAPFTCKIDGGWLELQMSASATGTADILLLDASNSVLATYSMTDDDVVDLGVNRVFPFDFGAEVEITAGATYRLALKPTNSTFAFYYTDVASAAHWQAHTGGEDLYLDTRTDAGAWSSTTTRRGRGGLHISQLHDGSGGGGASILAHPGMRGGFA